jgi:shikimate dehydrogenase
VKVYTIEELRSWSGEPVRFGVLGHPVAHSLSPAMHNAALEEMGLEFRYGAFDVAPDDLADALQLLRRNEFLGVNLTIPHKAAALSIVQDVYETARGFGAVNTLAAVGDGWRGFNTDGEGFERAIRDEFGVDLRDLRVLVLGAGGGAGRAIVWQCALVRCERLVLANRTPGKAEALFKELAPYFRSALVSPPRARLAVVPWDASSLAEELASIDLVVNATSCGMAMSDPPLLPGAALLPHLLVYDTIYKPVRTRLLRDAQEAGARAANGLSMLLHQGALALEIWTDREAPVGVMREALRKAAAYAATASGTGKTSD